MVNSTEEDCYKTDLTQYLLPLGCLGILISAGLVIQPFIVVVNLVGWMKGRSVTGTDKIMLSLGMSRLFLHIVCLLFCFSVPYPLEFPDMFSIFAGSVLYSSVLFNTCLSTLLSIFLYVNICTSHNIVFLRLKAIVSRKVASLIVASLLLSFAYTSVYFLVTDTNFFCNSIDYISDNKQNEKIMFYFYLLSDIFQCLIFFTSSALLIIFLGIHMSRMNSRGRVTSSTDVYGRTLMFTVASIIIWIFSFILRLKGPNMVLKSLWFVFMVNTFPVLHSILLVYVAMKLRTQFFRIVRCVTNLVLNRRASGLHSGETVEVTPM